MNLGTVIFIHGRIANALWIYMLIMAVWNFANYFRGRGVDGNVLGAWTVAELMTLTQAVLGIIMLVSGLFPASIIHFLYGSLSVLVIPAIWVYTRGAVDRRASLIWAITALFLFGLSLRAMGTGTAF
ncbi:MAG: hypothetical protein D6784_17445 [Chloroflexi bacterium]|nr:MAG: hypothetical protein D6784_17445 [Chloroflexota bacterium]